MLEIIIFTFGLLGSILIIYKNRWGFISYCIHSVAWGISSYADAEYGALATCVLFFAFDVYGFYRWSSTYKPLASIGGVLHKSS